MKSTLGAAVLGIALSAAAPAAGQLIMQRTLPLSLALEAAQTALATCAARGWHVTAVVVDPHGTDKVVLRDDRARGVYEVEIARRKAYTSLNGQPSSNAANMLDMQPNAYARQAYIDPRITPQAGGLPIKAGEETIAAIGISGASATPGVRGGTNDEICATAGIAKILDRLR
jgi:uncharacterized protein GlcG (DUF336 family)